jgi:RimJ/RimL family protein N-acetyltransferase
MSGLELDAIETDRLILRRLEEWDAPRIAVIANSPRIAEMLGTMPHPYRLADARAFLSALTDRLREVRAFAITSKEASGLLIGGCGYGPSAVRGETDFGYWLGLDYWGRGYATEAARALLAHAFEIGGAMSITTDHRKVNHGSGRVLRKVGFRPIGERRMHSLGARGHFDTIMLRLTREEWLAQSIQDRFSP